MNDPFLTPRAPRTFNTSAPNFDVLNTLLTSRVHVQFYWLDKATHLLGAHTKTNTVETPYRFTLAELEAVCPPLRQYLESTVVNPTAVESYKMNKTARTIWKHCSETSVLLRMINNQEVYCSAPRLIDSINLEEDTLCVVGYLYTLYLTEEDGYIVIKNGRVEDLPSRDQQLKINQLDSVYPSFRVRLTATLAMGMPKEEMVKYLFVADSDYKSSHNKLGDPLLGLPQITTLL